MTNSTIHYQGFELYTFIDYRLESVEDIGVTDDELIELERSRGSLNLEAHISAKEAEFFKFVINSMKVGFDATVVRKVLSNPYLNVFDVVAIMNGYSPYVKTFSGEHVMACLIEMGRCPESVTNMLESLCISINEDDLNAYKGDSSLDAQITVNEMCSLKIKRGEFSYWFKQAYRSSAKERLRKLLGINSVSKKKKAFKQKVFKTELSEYEETTYFNIIATLMEIVELGVKLPKVNKKHIVDYITEKYIKIDGLSKSTLDIKLKESQSIYKPQEVLDSNEHERLYLYIIGCLLSNILTGVNELGKVKEDLSHITPVDCVDMVLRDSKKSLSTCIYAKSEEVKELNRD